MSGPVTDIRQARLKRVTATCLAISEQVEAIDDAQGQTDVDLFVLCAVGSAGKSTGERVDAALTLLRGAVSLTNEIGDEGEREQANAQLA